MPTFKVTDPTSGKVLRLTGDSPPSEQELEEIFAAQAQPQAAVQPTAPQQPVQPAIQPQPADVPLPEQAQQVAPQPEEDGALDAIRKKLIENPATATMAEFGSAVNRGAVNLLDFFGPKAINSALELAGVEARIPEIAETEAGKAATTGEFMQDGLGKQAVRTAGEFVAPAGVAGQALRTAAAAIPVAKTVGQGVIKQLGAGTAAQDISGAVLSGVGAATGKEAGGDVGELAGAFFAPLAGSTVKNAMTGLFNAGKRGVEALMRPLANMSDDAASTLIAEAMVREGLTPKQVTARLKELGPEAIPADLGNNFARLLRTASNKIPRIEGQAADVLKARQAGQPQRLLKAVDDATGTGALTIDDAISHLDKTLKPEINRLYSEAGEKDIRMSPRLTNLLEGKSSVGRAQKKAQLRLADKRAAGDEISNIDIIDATKQELDDQIGKAVRQGENNKVRDLVRLKNVMIDEADQTIPAYKQARDLFAGKASLESAASSGESFLKMKPADISDLTKSFGKSEMMMYRLGAKKAILTKIDDLQTNADAVRRLFGKTGDVKKLRSLFDNEKAFNKFSDTLKRESDFIMTRRAAQANSTTAKQLSDDESFLNVLGDAAQAVSSPAGSASVANRIVNGLGKGKQDAIYIKALEEAGDILLIKGIEPQRIQAILKKGTSKQIEAQVRQALKKKTIKPYTAAVTGAAIKAFEDEQ